MIVSIACIIDMDKDSYISIYYKGKVLNLCHQTVL